MVIFVLSVAAYLLLAWSGGGIDLIEAGIAVVLGAVMAIAARAWNPRRSWTNAGLNPLRWMAFVFYLFVPFFWGMVKANFDVAYRVITGKIRPGIVRIDSGLKGSLAISMLANSITLTPGTLTVNVDDSGETGIFYVHWINVTDENPPESKIYGSFGKWAGRVAE
ncbi:MAG: Na+/H+ antiporter subunit E [Thermovirgaceae bacterium]|nr:Na+/H+ antiporter subunit E [Thermovirgaceae bacterium]